MIANYFIIIYRNLLRNKTYALINILGLAFGLSVCLIILEYVKFEESYDKFHPQSSNIYRAILSIESDGQLPMDGANFAPAAPALKNEYPEVVDFVRITPEYYGMVFNAHEKIFDENKVYYADSTFFTFFGYKLLVGDPKTALQDPNSVVLAQSTAEKYFGAKSTWNESPVGQLILINNKESFKITGVMEDTPANSHLRFEALVSFSTFLKKNDAANNWGWNDFYTYIKLNPSTDLRAFESKLKGFVKRHQKEYEKNEIVLQPLEDIHLYSNVAFELEANGSSQSVYFLTIIAFAILVIAWVNYINLSTARSEKRAKEVGIRKVNGATRNEIIGQLLLEAFLMNLIAVIIAVMIVQTSLPLVGVLLGKPLTLSLMADLSFLKQLILLYIVGSIISGIYPAFVLSTFKPVDIFKSGSHNVAKGKSLLRQSLVVFQFVVSIGLISGTIIINNQLHFVKTQNLGYKHEKTLLINSPRTVESEIGFLNAYRGFKQELLKYPEIDKVTISSSLPGKLSNDLDTNGPIRMAGVDDSRKLSFAVFRVDPDFADVFKLKMAAGKFYSNERPITDLQLIGDAPDDAVVINRRAAELLGYSDPSEIIGKKLRFQGREKEIIGVLEDYHHRSLKSNFEPILIRHRINFTKYISIRLSENPGVSLTQTIEKVNAVWKSTYAGTPFVYSFLQDDVNNHYREEDRFNKVFLIFSTFSILIGCLGLFGLVSYSVMVRTKEIGIRKVLGATISSIVVLFSKEFFKLIVIAFIIGIPLAVYAFNFWLSNFAYRAPLSMWMFVIPIVLVSVFAFLSVFAQILKASLTNPVDSLRSE